MEEKGTKISNGGLRVVCRELLMQVVVTLSAWHNERASVQKVIYGFIGKFGI